MLIFGQKQMAIGGLAVAIQTSIEHHYTVPEAAKVVGVSAKTMWRFVWARKVRSVLIGRSRRVPVSAIQEFIDKNTIPAANAA